MQIPGALCAIFILQLKVVVFWRRGTNCNLLVFYPLLFSSLCLGWRSGGGGGSWTGDNPVQLSPARAAKGGGVVSGREKIKKNTKN